MKADNSELINLLHRYLPSFEPVGAPELLEGGNLNHVWRLRGASHNLIIKQAPPYIAANPDVPLSTDRLSFESKALELFSPDGKLNDLVTHSIRPPRIYHYDANQSIMIMEDVGKLPDLTGWLQTNDNPEHGTQLGRFIGRLHRTTLNNPDLQQSFNNQTIQQTRFEVQYKPAAGYIRKAGVKGADEAGRAARQLGEKLLNPGVCLVMGDLWPPSVLVDGDQLRLIDWEFAHFGRPLQDVAHFAAHCWMQAHTAASDSLAQMYRSMWGHFAEAYRDEIGKLSEQLLSPEEQKWMGVHFGAEILMRTTGPFQDGYVFSGLDCTHKLIQDAVSIAVRAITDHPIDFLQL